MKVDVVRDLKRELDELQPALKEYERLPEYEAAIKAAAQTEADWRADPQRRNSNSQDDKTIELNGATSKAIDARDRVSSEGRQAQRRVKQINALLSAGDRVASLKTQIAAQRAARTAANLKVERAAKL